VDEVTLNTTTRAERMAMKVEADVGSVQDLCHALSAKVLRLEAEVRELRKKD
jgi:hypothetical protein